MHRLFAFCWWFRVTGQGVGKRSVSPDKEEARWVARQSSASFCLVVGSPLGHPDSEPVHVGIAEFDFMSPRGLFDRDAKFPGHRMNILDLKIDQCVWPRIALVFGEEEFYRSTLDGYKGGKSSLEAMNGGWMETKPPVPSDGNIGVLHAKYRDYFLFHLADSPRG